jgi:hypothetical protein
MEKGEDQKGFTIRDRRSSGQPVESAKEEPPKAEGAPPSEKRESGEDREPAGEFPEITFSSFVLSLSTSALVHLGEVPDPLTQKRDKLLPLAKQTIDMLGMLRDKTQGNLSPDEGKLLDHLLADLRWRYVREIKGQ